MFYYQFIQNQATVVKYVLVFFRLWIVPVHFVVAVLTKEKFEAVQFLLPFPNP